MEPPPPPHLHEDDASEEARRTRREAIVQQVLAACKDGVISKPKDIKVCFEIFGGEDDKQGQSTARCKFCCRAGSAGFKVSSSTRLVSHLSTCTLVPSIIKKGCVALEKERQQKSAASKHERAREEEEIERAVAAAKQMKKEKQPLIRNSLNSAENIAADQAIAEFFYACGISFNVASSEPGSAYRKMIAALRNTSAGYVPPNRHAIGGTLLDDAYARMNQKIKTAEEKSGRLNKYGCTYMSDGWESIDHLPLINSCYVCANSGGVFIRSVDTSGATKSAEYCASLMIEDIYTIGPHNVICVCTDTCATMEKAWGLVLDEFPWMMAIPCVTHVLSLLMKDVGSKVPAISQLIEEERIVVGWFANHQKPLAILRQKCLDMWGHSKELVKAAATRFGTNTLVGQRLLQLEVPLRQTVSDVEYLKERYRDKANEMEMTGCENKTRTHKGGTAAKLVSSTTDDNMWDRIRMHVDATLPIYKMLRRHDSSAPTIGKVYSGWFELGKSFTSSKAPYAADLKEFHEDRWSYGHCDILAAAYMLDPEFLGHDFNAEPEIKTGFFATIKHVAMLQYVKGNLENYQKAWEQRAAFLSKDPVHNIRKFDAYPLYDTEESKLFTIEFAKKAAAQHVLYEERHGPFAEEFIISAAEDMPAHLWWDKYGFCVKELQTVACYVLSQCPTASIIERIDSDFAFIKDKKRNRLKHDRADKLVALFHNLRMVNKMKKCAYVESAVGWNEEDMHTGIQKWGVTHYDIKST